LRHWKADSSIAGLYITTQGDMMRDHYYICVMSMGGKYESNSAIQTPLSFDRIR